MDWKAGSVYFNLSILTILVLNKARGFFYCGCSFTDTKFGQWLRSLEYEGSFASFAKDDTLLRCITAQVYDSPPDVNGIADGAAQTDRRHPRIPRTPREMWERGLETRTRDSALEIARYGCLSQYGYGKGIIFMYLYFYCLLFL